MTISGPSNPYPDERPDWQTESRHPLSDRLLQQGTMLYGVRLPMQAGSYLLNQDLQMIWGNQETFVQHWQFAQGRNSLDPKALERILKAARRRQFRVTGKAAKFLNDLNAEIEQGWTGPGQTNRLLGRIAMRSYIFGHVLYTDQPLEGNALVHASVTIAQALPGYHDWCQHQHEVEKRAQEWMQALEQSRYFHYGTDKRPVELSPDQSDESVPSWNQQQEAEDRARLQQAVAALLEKEALPSGITERFDALIPYGLSGATLYRHRDLWHPRHLQTATIGALQSAVEPDCSWTASRSNSHTN